MELSDYLLETLRQDDEFVLYRGRHRRPGEMDPPTMLLLTPRAEHPALASLRRMELGKINLNRLLTFLARWYNSNRHETSPS